MSRIRLRITKHFNLFVALLVFLLLHPILEGPGGSALLNIFNGVILLSAIYSVSEDRRHLRWGIALGVPAFAGIWFSLFIARSLPLGMVAILFLVAFYAYVVGVLIQNLFRQKRITGDMIYGTVSLYLLIGIAFAVIHVGIAILDPSAYVWPELLGMPPGGVADQFIYFSFVTLTTLGYGDILPVGGFARTVAYLEAVTGVFYAAVVISRFVSIHVAQGLEKS